MKTILILIPFLIACSSTKNPPNKEPSDYRPAVLPQALPPTTDMVNEPAAEPGSPQSPAVQQLPKATP